MYENECSNGTFRDTLSSLKETGSLIFVSGGSTEAKTRVQITLFGEPERIRIPVLAIPNSRNINPEKRYPWDDSEGADLAILHYDPEEPEKLIQTLDSMFKEWKGSDGAKNSHIRIGIDEIEEMFENEEKQEQYVILEKLSTFARKYCAMVHLIDRNDNITDKLGLDDERLDPVDILIEVRNNDQIEQKYNLIDEKCTSGWTKVKKVGKYD